MLLLLLADFLSCIPDNTSFKTREVAAALPEEGHRLHAVLNQSKVTVAEGHFRAHQGLGNRLPLI